MKNITDLRIVILGSGNVATHLSEALLNAGFSVLQLWKRGEVLRDADVYFIAVSDDAIEEVSKLIPDGKLFAHTSGSVELARGGVFYPLQTFTKNIDVDWGDIPILIENPVGAGFARPGTDFHPRPAGTPASGGYGTDVDPSLCSGQAPRASGFGTDCKSAPAGMLVDIAKKISTNVQMTTPEQRRQLHLSAVFACNFTNHLWTVAEQLLNEKDLSFDLLKPLIYQTVRKIENCSPRDVQTGPGVRGDLKTIARHREMLAVPPPSLRDTPASGGDALPIAECSTNSVGYPPPEGGRGEGIPAEIYEILTKSIQKTHNDSD